MKLAKVLENLEELLRKWGLCLDDWILIAHYAHRLEGYKVRFKKGHLNIMVHKDRFPWGKAPWKKGWKFQISPPVHSKWAKDFDSWQRKTGFHVDFIPVSTQELNRFAKNKKYSFIFQLANNKKVRVVKVRGFLRHYEINFPSVSSIEEELGIEKALYYLEIIKEWKKLAQEKKEKEIVNGCDRLLKKYEFLNNKLKTISDYRKLSRLKGTPAFQGTALGRVRVILDEADTHQLQKEEILVTKATSAKLRPIISRAKAIITDEGGMLNHTAILSRELGIPCVIDTRFATKVLKDGDLIKLDAEKGIVRILKKAK